jgi:hypothetical protein
MAAAAGVAPAQERPRQVYVRCHHRQQPLERRHVCLAIIENFFWRVATAPAAVADRLLHLLLLGRVHGIEAEVDQRPHQADADDDRDLWLRRHGHVTRRYGKRQIEQQPDDVIADLLEALSYAAASVTPADSQRSNRS